MFTTIIVFLAVLGILVVAHEWGHYIVARKNGITCHEFGFFGFPPRIFGFYKSRQDGKWHVVWGNREYNGEDTLFSLNWLPLGGFVRIKGENGDEAGAPDSFAAKGALARIAVLSAGVVMNMLLAWMLFAAVLTTGTNRAVSDNEAVGKDVRVQVAHVMPGSPAESMGLRLMDTITKICDENNLCMPIASAEDLSNFTQQHKGQNVAIEVLRGDNVLMVVGQLRAAVEPGEGPLGIVPVATAHVRYPLHIALWEGAKTTWYMTTAIFVGMGTVIVDLFNGGKQAGAVAGPVGIAQMTGQMAQLGITQLLQFMAMLSVNLAVINILPIPALDGGRILFIMIEKIKGSPVNKTIEAWVHGLGMVCLLLLMIVITGFDIARLF